MAYVADVDEIDGDLLDRSPAELRALFGAATSRRGPRAIRSRLMRAAVMQVARDNRLAAARGEPPVFQGHVRALWHALPEILLGRLSETEMGETPYETFFTELARMVFDRSAVTYSDLHITDPNWEERRIGDRYPHVVVVGEKRSTFRLLRRVHEQTGVTVCVTAGFAPGATCEYAAKHVLAEMGSDAAPILLGLVDHDPSGWLVMDVFQRHVAHFGLVCDPWRPVFRPEHIPPERLDFVSLPVTDRGFHRADEWLARSGGVGGALRRIELEALTTAELEAVVLDAVAEAIGS